ncbi:MAG: hypothetical protein IKB80_03840 [Oscillospiraceae bacterium]|nr:hypothetical protein [Oscillospiraceae bacterium]
MAQRVDVQYVQYYTPDSTARRVMPAVSTYFRPLPVAKKRKVQRICVDPVALLGIVVATAMMLMMAVGVSQLRVEQEKSAVMEEYVQRLEIRNSQLEAEYAASCDLEAVEKTALALGMIPAENAARTTITVEPAQTQTEITLWNRIGTFLTGLFA